MADHDIQKSRHLLKLLEEEMFFLSTIVSQIENLSSQVKYVSSGINKTWSDIDQTHKNWKEHTENS
jgi:peptidoglycan hydrolase CwlO-like protein